MTLACLAGVNVEEHDGAAHGGPGEVVHEEVRDFGLAEGHLGGEKRRGGRAG